MSAYRTAALLLKGVLVLRDTFQQRVLSCHGFDVLLELFACLGNLQGRKEGNVPCGLWEQAVTAELLCCLSSASRLTWICSVCPISILRVPRLLPVLHSGAILTICLSFFTSFFS